VHDLLRLACLPEGAPEMAPWAVVRREGTREGRIAIGLRGARREQRWGGWIAPDHVLERVTPEELAERVPARSLPALALLAPAVAMMRQFGWTGGPGGSVGFELASGIAAVNAGSDLDLVLRAPGRRAQAEAAELAAALDRLPGRIDALIETPRGAVALAEYAHETGKVARRGADGPRLVDDPWGEA
jgi:phosphoribosyl-dephospho-CoA transferase